MFPRPAAALANKGLPAPLTTATLVRVLRRIGPGPPALGRGNAFFTGTPPAKLLALIPSVGNTNDEPLSSAVFVVVRKGARAGRRAAGDVEMSASSDEPAAPSRNGLSVDALDTTRLAAPAEADRIGFEATEVAGFTVTKATALDDAGVLLPSDKSSHSAPSLSLLSWTRLSSSDPSPASSAHRNFFLSSTLAGLTLLQTSSRRGSSGSADSSDGC